MAYAPYPPPQQSERERAAGVGVGGRSSRSSRSSTIFRILWAGFIRGWHPLGCRTGAASGWVAAAVGEVGDGGRVMDGWMSHAGGGAARVLGKGSERGGGWRYCGRGLGGGWRYLVRYQLNGHQSAVGQDESSLSVQRPQWQFSIVYDLPVAFISAASIFSTRHSSK